MALVCRRRFADTANSPHDKTAKLRGQNFPTASPIPRSAEGGLEKCARSGPRTIRCSAWHLEWLAPVPPHPELNPLLPLSRADGNATGGFGNGEWEKVSQ